MQEVQAQSRAQFLLQTGSCALARAGGPYAAMVLHQRHQNALWASWDDANRNIEKSLTPASGVDCNASAALGGAGEGNSLGRSNYAFFVCDIMALGRGQWMTCTDEARPSSDLGRCAFMKVGEQSTLGAASPRPTCTLQLSAIFCPDTG